jgi:large subunit ribosomal protein L4
MNTDVFDQTGKKIGQVTLLDSMFKAVINPSLVSQSIRVRLMNAKLGTASTKTRAEVRGGGRKPWRQKGTGRARQGSIRSPQWNGGGIVHGPRPFKPELSMPRSMRHAALFSALTEKFNRHDVMIIDKIELGQPKAKEMQEILSKLAIDRSVLIVTSGKNDSLERSSRNLGQVKLMAARVLHPYEILQYKKVVFLQDSLALLEETFSNKKQASLKEKDKPADQSSKPSKKEKVVEKVEE